MCRLLKGNEVWGIRILDNSHSPWSRQFEHVLLDTSHPIFTKGELCPLTAACGFPLVIYSDSIHGGIAPMADNQPAMYLCIEPHDASAPAHWKSHDLGTCYVVRQDRKPLMKEAVEIVYHFHDRLQVLADPELISRGNRPWGGEMDEPPCPEWLLTFAHSYRESVISPGRKGYDHIPDDIIPVELRW